MLKTWVKKLLGGELLTVSGSIIYKGKGKQATPFLGIVKYKTASGGHGYEIDHIESGLLVVPNIRFLSQARVLAQEILKIESFPEATPSEFLIYLDCYRFSDVKQPPTFEEWKNGPEFEEFVKSKGANNSLVIRQEAEHAQELSDGFISLGWVPDEQGGWADTELREFVQNRYTSRKVIR